MLEQTRAVKMNVKVNRARRCDQPLAVAHRRAAGNDQARINAVHDGGITGLADADDAAMADAEIAFDDPDDGIDHDDVAQQEIERALRAGDTGHANSVAKSFAPTLQNILAIEGLVPPPHRRPPLVAQPTPPPWCRAVKAPHR